jgi:hypothetical protein
VQLKGEPDGARDRRQRESWLVLAHDDRDVGTGLAIGALDIYDRYFRAAIHPRW